MKNRSAIWLVVLIAAGLTFSSFHFHKTPNGNKQPVEHTNTDATISADTSLCPICGYIFKTDLFSSQSAVYVFNVRNVVFPEALTPSNFYQFVQQGRSPPFQA